MPNNWRLPSLVLPETVKDRQPAPRRAGPCSHSMPPLRSVRTTGRLPRDPGLPRSALFPGKVGAIGAAHPQVRLGARGYTTIPCSLQHRQRSPTGAGPSHRLGSTLRQQEFEPALAPVAPNPERTAQPWRAPAGSTAVDPAPAPWPAPDSSSAFQRADGCQATAVTAATAPGPAGGRTMASSPAHQRESGG